MKLAVVKLGARVIFGEKMGTSGGSGEARSLINMLAVGKQDVHVYTKILAKDEPVTHVKMHQMLDEYQDINSQGYDALCVINGSVNYMGGVDDPSQTNIYWMINNFKGPVFYFYCDPNLSLKQIWPSVSKKPWASNYKQSDIEITRADIRVICQIYNTQKCKEVFDKNGIKVQSVDQYPFEKFPMMFEAIRSEKLLDLQYGGTFRSGRREQKLIDFYFGLPDDISVEVFGKIKADDFNPKKTGDLRKPIFTGAVNYDKMIHKMSQGLVHTVIGDTQYPAYQMISQRAYESIQAGCVTLIDSAFDTQKIIFKDKELQKFCYVNNRSQVAERIQTLKADPKTAEDIVKMQVTDVDFNEKKYCKDFCELINRRI